jgi:hypothetical protein
MDSAGRRWYRQDIQTRHTNAQCSRASLECHEAPDRGPNWILQTQLQLLYPHKQE